jgi:hypothetical protein
VNVVAAVVTHAKPAKAVVKPSKGPLDRPAFGAKPGAVNRCSARLSARRDFRRDPPPPKFLNVGFGVVRSVGVQRLGLEAAARSDLWQRVQQRDQLGAVVAVCAGQRRRQRNAVTADDQVMFAAWTGPVDR